MNTTKAQQKELDDALVAPKNLALDALKLTPFYNAFEISTDVPEIYMQEFWVTVSKHHSSLRFKSDGKRHTVNTDNFRDMLKICPKLPVIVDYFMAKDQAIPRRNKMFWHYAKDGFMSTIVRVISKHQDTQVYGALLPQHLINQTMLEFEAYITYRAYATGKKTPKPKSIKKKANSESSPNTKPIQASKGKRIKTSAKGDKPATNSHTSGSGDGVDIQSKVPDEQQQTLSGINEGADNEDNDEHDSANDNDDEDDDQENVSGETESDDDRDDFVHPNLSTYKEDDQEEEKEEEKANDDDEVSSDQRLSHLP
ncbi:hypothetical protein Tco_0727065 [Tanacetum coccineum]|uniref:Uncharacterized protein n=1 Tax=Tanacetum coccineum TaxID=301880 RepID=A0ABQ4YHC7_9ASTR